MVDKEQPEDKQVEMPEDAAGGMPEANDDAPADAPQDDDASTTKQTRKIRKQLNPRKSLMN